MKIRSRYFEGPAVRKPERHRGRMKGMGWCAGLCLIALALLVQSPACAGDGFFPVELVQDSAVGIGIGSYPDYIGSDDYAIGAAPFLRYQFAGERYVTLLANELRANLLDDAHWRLGPSMIYRFGRDGDSVDDEVVERMHEVDDSFDIGFFTGYDWYNEADPFKRISLSVYAHADVTGGHDGFVYGGQLYGAYPMALPVLLMGGLASTYGSEDYMDEFFGVTLEDTLTSGLSSYEADGGIRDVRGWLMAMFHFSEQWHVMGGVMYSALMEEASDSPIVDDRGSSDQWVVGAGGLFTW